MEKKQQDYAYFIAILHLFSCVKMSKWIFFLKKKQKSTYRKRFFNYSVLSNKSIYVFFNEEIFLYEKKKQNA